LREAGVRAQVFTIPTRGFPIVDGIGAFCSWRGWPRAARRSPLDRALWQIEELHRAAARSAGEVRVVANRDDLDAALAAGQLAAILGIEGAYPLEGNPKHLERFAKLGVRILGPAHLIPNEFTSCSYWMYRDRGISALGRELLGEMARERIALDLAHASPRAVDEMLGSAPAELAILDSHTAMAAVSPMWRNLSDARLKAIAARGGLVAIILARKYLGGSSLGDFAAHARHAAEVAGAGAIAIGSDFDGFVAPPRGIRDVRDYPKLAGALKRARFDRAAATGILGANLVGFLRRALPPREAGPGV
jgi:membrane dipeptidase